MHASVSAKLVFCMYVSLHASVEGMWYLSMQVWKYVDCLCMHICKYVGVSACMYVSM
jgi:hypothetical protein